VSSLLFGVASSVVIATSQPSGFPAAPGRLVDVGGRKPHLHCTGAASPTLVFEAGASAFAIDFSLVQRDVARSTRACSYDRIGHGWSDPRGDTDPETAVVLHDLLRAAGEKPPYVLVGASRRTLRPPLCGSLPC
jgi:pimeloyl-ACP methyl ester carboxylesterase